MNTTKAKTTTIEMVTYRLKADKTSADLAATHDAVNEFLQTQAGFLYRSCSTDDSGLVYDIVYWQTLALAQAAGEAFMAHSSGQALVALTDEHSIIMRHMLAETEAAGEGGCSNAA